MSEMLEPNDKLLDENLDRLLADGSERPTISPDAESRMLDVLKAKQAELYAPKEQEMKPIVTSPARGRRVVSAAFLVVVSVIVLALFIGSPQSNRPHRESGKTYPAPVTAKTVGADQITRHKLADGSILIAQQGSK